MTDNIKNHLKSGQKHLKSPAIWKMYHVKSNLQKVWIWNISWFWIVRFQIPTVWKVCLVLQQILESWNYPSYFFNFQSSLGESSSSVMSTSESQPEAGLIDRSKHLEHELQSLHDKIQQMTSDKVNIKLQWGSYYRTCPVFKWSKQVQFAKVSDFEYCTGHFSGIQRHD